MVTFTMHVIHYTRFILRVHGDTIPLVIILFLVINALIRPLSVLASCYGLITSGYYPHSHTEMGG